MKLWVCMSTYACRQKGLTTGGNMVIDKMIDYLKADITSLYIYVGVPQLAPPEVYPQMVFYGVRTTYSGPRATHTISVGLSVENGASTISGKVTKYTGFYDLLSLIDAVKASIAGKFINLEVYEETIDLIEHNNIYSVKMMITCQEIISSKGQY